MAARLPFVTAHLIVDGMPKQMSQFYYDGLNRLRIRIEAHWEDAPPDLPSGIQPDTPISPGDGSWVVDSETRYTYDGRKAGVGSPVSLTLAAQRGLAMSKSA